MAIPEITALFSSIKTAHDFLDPDSPVPELVDETTPDAEKLSRV